MVPPGHEMSLTRPHQQIGTQPARDDASELSSPPLPPLPPTQMQARMQAHTAQIPQMAQTQWQAQAHTQAQAQAQAAHTAASALQQLHPPHTFCHPKFLGAQQMQLQQQRPGPFPPAQGPQGANVGLVSTPGHVLLQHRLPPQPAPVSNCETMSSSLASPLSASAQALLHDRLQHAQSQAMLQAQQAPLDLLDRTTTILLLDLLLR